MLISLNWVKQYVDVKISDRALIKLIGARLVEVEQVIDQTHKYDRIFAVKVEHCTKLPGTHLSLCAVNDGGQVKDGVTRDADGNIQVVCGAPNVHRGMLSAWIAPGAVVPATANTTAPLVIGARKMLKKYDSFGMLAGLDELDFGDDHSGIVELDPQTAHPGDQLSALFDLNDLILDIENKSLTHRPDTFGIIGFAREVAGILGQKAHLPEWYDATVPQITASADAPALNISIADPALCPRYSALVLTLDRTVSAPHYLNRIDTLLARSGMRPVDAIVDIANYFMLLSGQPLHTFDFDKFIAVGKAKTPTVLVRSAQKGEKLTLLDANEITLNPDDIVITSNGVPVALAGAMGGQATAVDGDTKRILLESAVFSLYNLRKTQMAHGIFSEAITRFTKGPSTAQTLTVATQCATALQPLCRTVAQFDCCARPEKTVTLDLHLDKIGALLGRDFTAVDATTLLENVGFKVSLRDASAVLRVTVPSWRTDIQIPEDLIEEIGRLSGFDNITPAPLRHGTATRNPLFTLKTTIRDRLSAYGANEVLTYSFVHGDLITKVGLQKTTCYRIVNSISPDLQYIRRTLVPSLLDKAYPNLRAGHERFALFEMNQCFEKTAVPSPQHHLAFLLVDPAVATSSTGTPSASTGTTAPDAVATPAYFTAKLYLERLLHALKIPFTLQNYRKTASAPYYQEKRSAVVMIDGATAGFLGEIDAGVLRKFKLSGGVSAFELDLEMLLKHQGKATVAFRPHEFPFVARDLTLSIPATASDTQNYATLEARLRRVLDARGLIYGLSCGSIYRHADAPTRSVNFRLRFSHPAKTLTKAEIQDIMKALENISGGPEDQ